MNALPIHIDNCTGYHFASSGCAAKRLGTLQIDIARSLKLRIPRPARGPFLRVRIMHFWAPPKSLDQCRQNLPSEPSVQPVRSRLRARPTEAANAHPNASRSGLRKPKADKNRVRNPYTFLYGFCTIFCTDSVHGFFQKLLQNRPP